MRNFVITITGKNYQVGVEEVGATPSQTYVAPVAQAVATAPIQAAPVQTAPVAKATTPAAPKASAPVSGEEILSPFPGLIKNVLVAEGAKVEKDQPILVLEAMKMDNDITATCAGVVHFQVAKGSNVESDSVLAVIS